MSAAYLPAIGAEYGPCAGECKHRDCAETRRRAEVACHFCGKSIGFDSYYYETGNDQLGHRRCVEADAAGGEE